MTRARPVLALLCVLAVAASVALVTATAQAATPAPVVTQIAFTSTRSGNSDVWLMNPDGTNPVQLTHKSSSDSQPAWSPDGTQIAFTSTRSGNSDVWLMNPDGTNPVQLTHKSSSDSQPAWSPDGTQIAFTSTRSGNSDVWLMNPDGTNPVQLTHKSSSDSQPAWSPDGTQIAFTSTRSGNSDVWLMNPDGTNPVQLTHKSSSDSQPAWSPDGTQIAFTSTRSGNSDVWLLNPDGTNPVQLTSGSDDANAGWSPDGGQLAYDSKQGAATDIMVVNADGSSGIDVANGGTNSDPAWQPAPQPVVFATLDEPVGVVASPTRLLVTEECSDTVWVVHATGSVSPFATLPSTDNKCEERYLTQAPDGTYYVAANRRVYSVSADGGVAEVRTLPGTVPPQGIGITWDSAGTWGGQLVLTSNDGQVFELTTDGTLRQVATLGEQTESPRIVPAGFGSFEGDILLSSKDLGQVQALAPDGTLTLVGSWPTPENATVVPSTLCSLGGQSYFVAVPELGQIVAYPAGRLPVGQILVGSEIDTSIGIIAADGTTSTFSTGLATPEDEGLEGAAFCA